MTEISSNNLRRRILTFAVVISFIFSIWLMTRIIPDIRGMISTIEILFFIPLPLAVFYIRSNWSKDNWLINLVVLIILWYFTYSLLHELSHLTVSVMLGRKITAYQLIPKYLEGEFFTGAGVASEPTNQFGITFGFLAGLAPYIKDVILLIIGYLILKSQKLLNSFLSGLIFIICILSSLFDIANNYSIYIINPNTVGNDFQGTALEIGRIWTNIIGVLFTVFSLFATLRILMLYKGFPLKQKV